MTRIAFLGTPAVAVPALQALASAHAVEAVFCNPDKPTGRGRHLEAPPVKKAALELGIPVHQPASWKAPETRALWESLNVDLAIVIAYGHILPNWMLDSCSLGVWNLHFSLLPRWRGAAPVNYAVMAGDTRTGVCLIRLTQGMDAGPVLARWEHPIELNTTAEDLLAVLAGDAAELLTAHLPGLLSGCVETTPQDDTQATFATKLHKGMAHVDFSRGALAIHRQVRALFPWPGVELDLEGTVVKVCAVGGIRASHESPGTLCWDRTGAWLVAGDGQAVELTHLQRPGKPVQPAIQALQPWGPSGSKLVTP
jgi:methionyl-tRNA formyltransferase